MSTYFKASTDERDVIVRNSIGSCYSDVDIHLESGTVIKVSLQGGLYCKSKSVTIFHIVSF